MRTYARSLTLAAFAALAFVVVPSPAGAAGDVEGDASDVAAVGLDAFGGEVLSPAACIPAEKCCRVCSAGKACGKSCIQASKQCHKGRGCACNESEICAAGGE